jgi:hypothetical protein
MFFILPDDEPPSQAEVAEARANLLLRQSSQQGAAALLSSQLDESRLELKKERTRAAQLAGQVRSLEAAVRDLGGAQRGQARDLEERVARAEGHQAGAVETLEKVRKNLCILRHSSLLITGFFFSWLV